MTDDITIPADVLINRLITAQCEYDKELFCGFSHSKRTRLLKERDEAKAALEARINTYSMVIGVTMKPKGTFQCMVCERDHVPGMCGVPL